MKELEVILSVQKGISTPGPDGIPYIVLVKLPSRGKEVFLKLINLSWKLGSLPISWKQTYVIPIVKPNKDNKLLESSRPISLTNCIVKIVEKMVAARLKNYLELNNLININQAGFHKSHSTLDQAIRLKTEAENVTKSGNMTV